MTILLAAVWLFAATPTLDSAKIEQHTGLKGTLDAKSGTFKVSAPRADLAVTVNGVHVTPAMALTFWAAFHAAGKETMVMGDTVLAEDQVNPVMSVALENGLEVTALHNHFFWDSPRVMFMHIGVVAIHQHMVGEMPRTLFLHFWGVGKTEDLARGLAAAVAKTKG